jgi:diguanylate cyclase (GGDEF)-like protein
MPAGDLATRLNQPLVAPLEVMAPGRPHRARPLPARRDGNQVVPVSEREIEESFWHKQIDLGLLVWLLGAAGVFTYLHATPHQPHRFVLSLLTAAGVASSLAIFWFGGRQAIRTRWRTPFFLAWSLGSMLIMAAGASLDGGARSPFVWLITLPVLFAGTTYSTGAVALLAAAAEVMYLGLAFSTHGSAPPRLIVGSSFSIAGILMIVGAWNRRTQDRQLTDLAVHDALTGCLTHAALKERLAREILAVRGERRPLSLLVAEVDRLAIINDVRGHSAGDDVLATVGKALAAQDVSDLVGRIGGDEFAVIVSDVGEGDLPQLVSRARTNLERRVPDWIGVTFGAATLREADTASDLLKRADRALYAAKQRPERRSA